MNQTEHTCKPDAKLGPEAARFKADRAKLTQREEDR